MNVFIVGGTGAIGAHALRALVLAGHRVSALVRSPAKAQWVTKVGAEPVWVSLFDREALARELTGRDAVVNLATAIPASSGFVRSGGWSDNDRIRREGVATLVAAAQDAGVPRLVQESVSMIYRDAGAQWIDEACETDRFPLALGNHAAESSVQNYRERGGEGVILRFGWFYGPGARHSEEFLDLARRFGVCVMLGRASGYVSSINVQDGGRAVVHALNVPSGTYNVVDDEPLTKAGYANALAAAVGRTRTVRVPGRLAVLLGDRVTGLTRSLRVANKRFREATGWSPDYPSAREGLRAMAAPQSQA